MEFFTRLWEQCLLVTAAKVQFRDWPSAGVRLTTVDTGALRLTRATIWVPDRRHWPDAEVLRILEQQNPELSTAKWRVRMRREDEKGLLLVVGIDNRSVSPPKSSATAQLDKVQRSGMPCSDSCNEDCSLQRPGGDVEPHASRFVCENEGHARSLQAARERSTKGLLMRSWQDMGLGDGPMPTPTHAKQPSEHQAGILKFPQSRGSWQGRVGG